MRFLDLIALSTRMFTTRPMRTFLTILGVGVGIGAVLFLVSLGYGLQRVILGQITTADALLSLDVAPSSSAALVLDQQHVDTIAALPEVEEVARRASATGQLGDGTLTSDSRLYAVDDGFFRLQGLRADAGGLVGAGDRSIVVSSATAKLFNTTDEEMLGKELAVTLYVPKGTEANFGEISIVTLTEPYTVVGVVRDDAVSYAYLPLGTVSAGTFTSYDLVKVKVTSEAVAAPTRDAIIGMGFLVSSLSDVIDQANSIFRILQIILALFGLIALAVSAIGMFNTMTIALLERINEIGIMQSVGVARADIRKLFLIESMLMGFLGGVGGVLLGFLAGELANLGLNLLASNLGGQSLDVFYQPAWFVIVIISFSTLIGLLTGVFPARRAARMDPLEALRYK